MQLEITILPLLSSGCRSIGLAGVDLSDWPLPDFFDNMRLTLPSEITILLPTELTMSLHWPSETADLLDWSC
jgi:hypothetical protein